MVAPARLSVKREASGEFFRAASAIAAATAAAAAGDNGLNPSQAGGWAAQAQRRPLALLAPSELGSEAGGGWLTASHWTQRG